VLDRLVLLALAGPQLPQALQGAQVVRLLLEQLFILPDRLAVLALLGILGGLLLDVTQLVGPVRSLVS